MKNHLLTCISIGISLFILSCSGALNTDNGLIPKSLTIDLPVDQDGNIWVFDKTTYVNGVAQETSEYKIYMWGIDSEGYSNYSDNPSSWSTLVKLENHKLVTKTGGIWLYFQESHVQQPYSETDGINIVVDSVTVDNNFISWDGEVRTALISHDSIINGTQGLYEKPANGTTEKWYVTSEGYERWDTYSPSGELIESNKLVNRIYEYDYVKDSSGTEIIIEDSTEINWTSVINNWYTLEFDSKSEITKNNYNSPMSDLTNFTQTIAGETSTSLVINHQSPLEIGNFDSVVVTYSSDNPITVFLSDINGAWAYNSIKLLPASSELTRVVLSQKHFTYSYGDIALSDMTKATEINLKFPNLTQGDIVNASIESIVVFNDFIDQVEVIDSSEIKWLDEVDSWYTVQWNADWGTAVNNYDKPEPNLSNIEIAVADSTVTYMGIYPKIAKVLGNFDSLAITYTSNRSMSVLISDINGTWWSSSAKGIEVAETETRLVLTQSDFGAIESNEPIVVVELSEATEIQFGRSTSIGDTLQFSLKDITLFYK